MKYEEKQIIEAISAMDVWLKYGYYFTEINFKQNNPDIDVPHDSFGMLGTQAELKRNISILSGAIKGEPDSYAFFVRISQTNSQYPDIYFEKYLIENYGEESLKKMSLFYFSGGFEEKLNQFIVFFESVLSDDFMKCVLAGTAWSDKYHKHLWEGTDR